MIAPAVNPAKAADSLRSIVVIGGGFAGCAVARGLQRRLPDGYRLLLISEESYTTFNPLLAEVVGASIFPAHVVAPLRQVILPSDTAQFVMARVHHIDLTRRTIACETLAGVATIAFDQLVLAFGNSARTDFLPGFAENALPIKTVGDAIEIRNVVLRRVAQIELETDPAVRARLGHFVIVGGGFSGVEVAGELVDFLRGIGKYYSRVRPEELTVTLVHDQDQLLPELPAPLRKAAHRSLERRGVRFRLSVRAAQATTEKLVLAGGDVLDARTLIASAGSRPNRLVESLGAPLKRGRIVVAPDFSVAALAGVWAIGDCAYAVNAWDRSPCPPTAQFAVRQGEHLANNLRRAIAGRSTQSFRYRACGQLATIGRLNGVAAVMGTCVTGLPAWLLWRAFYLSRMPTFGRKLRLWAEWTWGMIFSADITHFRFTRSGGEE
jgi:NADH dehydrogenase